MLPHFLIFINWFSHMTHQTSSTRKRCLMPVRALKWQSFMGTPNQWISSNEPAKSQFKVYVWDIFYLLSAIIWSAKWMLVITRNHKDGCHDPNTEVTALHPKILIKQINGSRKHCWPPWMLDIMLLSETINNMYYWFAAKDSELR